MVFSLSTEVLSVAIESDGATSQSHGATRNLALNLSYQKEYLKSIQGPEQTLV